MHCRDFTRQSVAAFVKGIQRLNFRFLVLVLLAASLPRVSKFLNIRGLRAVSCGKSCFSLMTEAYGDPSPLIARFSTVSSKGN